MDVLVAQINPWLVTLILGGFMLAGWACGWAIGRRHPADPDDKSSPRFVDGTLALLGLLLGFTFAMALNKHEQRRLMIISDCNSIADFYTCATILDDPARSQLQEVIRQYVKTRLKLAYDRPSRAAADEYIHDSEALQDEMTRLVRQTVHDGTPMTIPLVNTLNNLTSNHASLLAAMRDRLPGEVLILLAIAAVASTVLVGRQHGRRNKAQIVGTVSYVLLVALSVYVILDLNQPSAGLIRVNTDPLERLGAALVK